MLYIGKESLGFARLPFFYTDGWVKLHFTELVKQSDHWPLPSHVLFNFFSIRPRTSDFWIPDVKKRVNPEHGKDGMAAATPGFILRLYLKDVLSARKAVGIGRHLRL